MIEEKTGLDLKTDGDRRVAWLSIDDFEAKDAVLSAEEVGSYLRLLVEHRLTDKPLPDDDEQLARIAHTSLANWQQRRPALFQFFTQSPEGWTPDCPLLDELPDDDID